jgi:hypothetical protein
VLVVKRRFVQLINCEHSVYYFDPLEWVYCYCDMSHVLVADGEGGLQIWRVVAMFAVCSYGGGQGMISHHNQNVTKS